MLVLSQTTVCKIHANVSATRYYIKDRQKLCAIYSRLVYNYCVICAVIELFVWCDAFVNMYTCMCMLWSGYLILHWRKAASNSIVVTDYTVFVCIITELSTSV